MCQVNHYKFNDISFWTSRRGQKKSEFRAGDFREEKIFDILLDSIDRNSYNVKE